MDQKNKEPESHKIVFTPLSDGLGFHPFSDGLPYAPVAKNMPPQTNKGAGAVSAGPPKMAYPQKEAPKKTPHIPQINVPVANEAFESNRAQSLQSSGSRVKNILESISPASTPLPTAPAQSISIPEQPKVSLQIPAPRKTWVHLFKRVMAFLSDTLIHMTLLGAALHFLLWKDEFNYDLFENTSVLLVSFCVLVAFQWSSTLFQEVVFKTSIGKALCGLRLKGSAARIFVRALLFFPSLGLVGIGLLWSVFDSRKRCWHDRVAGVEVVEKL